MRQKIVKSMCILAALAAAVVAVALLMLERYWIEHYGAGALMQPEYIFYVVVILALALTAAMLLSLLLANSIVRPLERSEDDYVELSHLKRRLTPRTAFCRIPPANWRKRTAISAWWWPI